MTDLETRMLNCIREYRRLENQTVRSSSEVAANHQEADALCAMTSDDDLSQRFDAPNRVAHRAFVDRLFDPKFRD